MRLFIKKATGNAIIRSTVMLLIILGSVVDLVVVVLDEDK